MFWTLIYKRRLYRYLDLSHRFESYCWWKKKKIGCVWDCQARSIELSVLGSLNLAGLRGFLCCVWTVGLYLRIRLPTDRHFPCFGECSRNLECLSSSSLLPQFLSHCGGRLSMRSAVRLLRCLAPDLSYFAPPCRGRLVSSSLRGASLSLSSLSCFG